MKTMNEERAAIEAAYASVADGGWDSVKDMGIEMFQAGAAWQRAQGAAPDASAMAKVLSDRVASAYCVDPDDNWKIYGQEYIEDVRAMLAALSAPSHGEQVERLQMQLVACGVVALANTPESAARARDMHPDYMSASCSDVMRAVDREMHQRADLLDWAVERWYAEVSQRPLHNVHRRSIDDTWRQVIRRLGGDPAELCGPDHDTLIAAGPSAGSQEQGE